MAKARIRQNRYDNWYGYVGQRRVEAFGNTPTGSAEENAKAWLTKFLLDQNKEELLKIAARDNVGYVQAIRRGREIVYAAGIVNTFLPVKNYIDELRKCH
jgi:hypothetical protein